MFDLSWPLKRLLMAEVENEAPDDLGEDEDEGDYGITPSTLGSSYESLASGYEPYDGFDREKIQKELSALIAKHGEHALSNSFLTKEDWEKHARCTPYEADPD